jgi:hypothetical protein
VPAAPISLVQAWVQDAYDDLAGTRHWAWLRQESILRTLAQRSLTVTFTQGATGITSAAGFVTTTDPGRQIRVGANTPIYTILSVTDVNTATLTQAFAETGGAQTASIHDRYLVMPADFRAIHDVTDLSIQRPVAWWISRERLDLFDPGRVASDSRFRVLASYMPSAATATLGRTLYEAWPAPTAAGSYLLHYFKRSDALADDDVFTGVLATKVEALIDGALARAARWPGTADRRNPYFNLQLSTMLEAKFETARQTLDVMDDDQYLLDLSQTDLSKFGLAALSADTTLMRQSDATLADYY